MSTPSEFLATLSRRFRFRFQRDRTDPFTMFGKPRSDGEKFFGGAKDSPAWVRDLNWKNRCKLETQELEHRRKLKATMRTQKLLGKSGTHHKLTESGKIRMKMGSHGAMVPEDDQDVLLEKLAFQKESKRPVQMYRLTPETGRRTDRSGASSFRTGRSTGRTTGRSTGRYTGRSSTGSMSSIGSINTLKLFLLRPFSLRI